MGKSVVWNEMKKTLLMLVFGVNYMRMLLSILCIVMLGGCVPNEINDASNAYGKENYSAVIRHLNEFLSKEKLYLKIDDNIIAAKYIAIAYFYRGLAKRACLLKQMSIVPADYNESYQFRFKKNNFFIDADDIVKDFQKARNSSSQLYSLCFFMALELALKGNIEKSYSEIELFLMQSSSEKRNKLVEEVGSEQMLSLCIDAANFLKTKLLLATKENDKSEISKYIISWYRRVLFAKSIAHEKKNINILMKKYAVRRFEFIREIADLESKYDFFEKTVECGMDFLIVRNVKKEDNCLISSELTKRGFSKQRQLASSSNIIIMGRMGVKIFEGNEQLPINISYKNVDFGKKLVAIFSVRKKVWYFVVVERNANWEWQKWIK